MSWSCTTSRSSTRSGRSVGYEALVRWQHPEQGLISPDKFIPLAERIGAIDAVGLWVLEEACRQLAAWLEGDPAQTLRLSVNLSPSSWRVAS